MQSKATIQASFATKAVFVKDGTLVKLQMWDTAGSEQYRSLQRTYFQGAHCAIIVYDVSSEATIKSVPRWLEDVKDCTPKDCLICLCANKIDLREEGQTITRRDG